MTIPIKFKRGKETNLPSSAPAGEPLFTTDTHKLFIGTGTGIISVGADPALKDRIDSIEKQRSTITYTHHEDFSNRSRIDFDKTTAAVRTNEVRVAKTASFQESFENTNYYDKINSSNILFDTSTQKAALAPGNLEGILYSKPIPVKNSDTVTINANTVLPSTMAFSHSERLTNDDTRSYFQPIAFTDRTNRTWHVAFLKTEGVYYRVENPDGSLAFEKISPTPFSSDFDPASSYGSFVSNVSFVVDYNNRVWLGVPTSKNNYSRHLYLGCINSDGSFIKDWRIISTAGSADLYYKSSSLCVDKNNHIWFGWTYGSMSTYVIKFDSEMNILIPAFPLPGTNSFAYGHLISLNLFYDNAQEAIVSIHHTDSKSGVYLTKISLTGAPIQTIKQLTIQHFTDSLATYFDPDTRKIIIAAVRNASPRSIYVCTIDPVSGTLLQAKALTRTADRIHSLVKDGNTYRFTYDTQLTGKICSLSVNADTLEIADDETIVTNFNGSLSYVYKDSNQNIRCVYASTAYSKNLTMMRSNFVSTPSSVTMEISPDHGAQWLPAPNGQEIKFSSPTDTINLRIKLITPTVTMTPEITKFSLTIGGESGTLSQEFVSNRLPSVSPILNAVLTAEEDQKHGTISWFITNDGGSNWLPATLGEQITFPNPINSDLRVKAILHSPSGVLDSPAIHSFTVLSSNLVSDFIGKTGTNLTATMSADQTLTAADTFTKINFNQTTHDAIQEFDKSQSRFVAKAPGEYLIIGSARIKSPTTSPNGLHLEIRINGELHKVLSSIVSYSNHAWCLNGSSIVQLKPGDYVELFGYSFFANGVIEATPAYSYFQIKQLW
ncbi:hypothetical protein ABER61_27675 [Brevibacillus formosus]|uniref:Major tropism determinant N-terminal domain-containing protein n=1 Tax=Brevibacillus formosus TaxID=54913 RepID=A0A837KJW7_9BACL|nr:hypothetical protein [Brevibacillus formosus]KLH97483.1 hypothetical protein AA984_20320 [Brevibacillus formosus]MED1955558.1 hypothetical protein [Brevibacillus formosus]PSJ93212.1 hypothetical protein C7R91_20755 [Brevibacillus formosus]GED60267.1 hypothetical protein BFO01nite_43990 [Brevibacillus formosus]